MRACGRELHESMWWCFELPSKQEPQFPYRLSVQFLSSDDSTCSLSIDQTNLPWGLSLISKCHLTYQSLLPTRMSAIRSSIRVTTSLLRSARPNTIYRASIGSSASITRSSRLPSTLYQATSTAVRYYASSSDQANAKTSLYDLHVAKGAKMVPFGGYMMPVQYSDLGVGESHKWTREKASLFDVSHM
jgi:hypothetical protein